jgi:fatty-acyl-CoA synthase
MRTVGDALDWAAQRDGEGFTFVANQPAAKQLWTFAALALESRRIAHALTQLGLKPGDRVGLVLPEGDQFVRAFLGVTRAGAVAVPMYPPLGLGQLGRYLEHARHIAGRARLRLVITTPGIRAVIGGLREHVQELREILCFDDLAGDAQSFREHRAGLDDTCFLQFSSGSTSRPKGVVVSHANLAHNCHAIMRNGLATDERDRGVSWLPLFHDMGLIGFVLAPIYHQVPVTFMAPLDFVKRPLSWLRYVSEHRGTITYGPNFAYGLVASRARDADLHGLDLSCLRVAGCGAEPIRADTLRAFAARFADVGFRPEAFVPSYGMAESTLAISFARGLHTERVDGRRLWEAGVADTVDEASTESVELVCCGPAFPEHAVRVVDSERQVALPERSVGELQLRGPSVMSAYFDDAASTLAARSPDGWLRTGDLGYLADGNVYVCGRSKEVIIVNGRNYYPQDIEWAASEIAGIRSGSCVAFAAGENAHGQPAIVVVAESRVATDSARLEGQVLEAVRNATGLALDRVLIVKPSTIPKTSSGKLQRIKARELYEQGRLEPAGNESKLQTAKRIAGSQLTHLRHRFLARKLES